MPSLSLPRWIHRNVIFPAVVHLRGEGSLYRRLQLLEELQWHPQRRLLQRQGERLAELLSYAHRHSAYYRRRWSERTGFEPATAFNALAELPTVTKADLQASFQEMIARPRERRTTTKVTGGSTGQAVTVIKNRSATAAEMAASWLGYGWFGVRIGDRAARFWGNPATLKRRLRFVAADLATHRIRFSAFAFDDADLAEYWERCLRFQPDYFYGYVSMLTAFASFVANNSLDGRRLRLKAVITTSEVLGEPQRELLKHTFGTRVQNEYGCGEVGPVAYECEKGSLHIMSENLVLEVLSANGEPAPVGVPGDIVLTDLNNRAMPLIRYRVGDVGVIGEPCACGRGFPVLEKVWGREYDFVQTPDKRRFHGEFFMYFFEDLRSHGAPVDKFQIVQSGERQLEIKLVYKVEMAQQTLDRISLALTERLPGMTITSRQVDKIPPTASGKSVVVQNQWMKQSTRAMGPSAS
jgi:phenylacetate-CoA ligase